MNKVSNTYPEDSPQKYFLPVLVICGILFLISQVINYPLINSSAPAGIVSFELAKTQQQAAQILASWGNSIKIFAGFGIGFDFLFIPSYVAVLYLGCFISSRSNGKIHGLSAYFGWAPFLAGAFDCIENIAMLRSLMGFISLTTANIAYYSALVKFSLLFISFSFCIITIIIKRKRA